MAATYLSSDKYKTLPFAVYNFAGQYASNYSVQFAVMALVALPSLIIYILMNEQITKGAMAGAVK
jgi:raffinose/stachyose/melibiose transport system permease protein